MVYLYVALNDPLCSLNYVKGILYPRCQINKMVPIRYTKGAPFMVPPHQQSKVLCCTVFLREF